MSSLLALVISVTTLDISTGMYCTVFFLIHYLMQTNADWISKMGPLCRDGGGPGKSSDAYKLLLLLLGLDGLLVSS